MKNIVKVTVAVTVIFLVSSFTLIKSKKQMSDYVAIEAEFEIPENIQKIFEKSCFDCHNSKAKGKKSKMKFNIENLTNGKYSQKKIASKMRKIIKTVDVKQSMPPKKIIAKYPQIALTNTEREVLINWAKEQNNNLTSQEK